MIWKHFQHCWPCCEGYTPGNCRFPSQSDTNGALWYFFLGVKMLLTKKHSWVLKCRKKSVIVVKMKANKIYFEPYNMNKSHWPRAITHLDENDRRLWYIWKWGDSCKHTLNLKITTWPLIWDLYQTGKVLVYYVIAKSFGFRNIAGDDIWWNYSIKIFNETIYIYREKERHRTHNPVCDIHDRFYPINFQVFFTNVWGILMTLHYSKQIGSFTYSQLSKQNFLPTQTSLTHFALC